MRSVSRVTGVSINTVSKLLIDAGNACADFHDAMVRNVPAQRVQCDEIWSFSYAKQKNVKFAYWTGDEIASIQRIEREAVGPQGLLHSLTDGYC
jgi:hypothetical protein